jgi:hypothetical protein
MMKTFGFVAVLLCLLVGAFLVYADNNCCHLPGRNCQHEHEWVAGYYEYHRYLCLQSTPSFSQAQIASALSQDDGDGPIVITVPITLIAPPQPPSDDPPSNPPPQGDDDDGPIVITVPITLIAPQPTTGPEVQPTTVPVVQPTSEPVVQPTAAPEPEPTHYRPPGLPPNEVLCERGLPKYCD